MQQPCMSNSPIELLNVTACFVTDLGCQILCCDTLRCQPYPHDLSQNGYVLFCKRPLYKKEETYTFPHWPIVLLIKGFVDIPYYVLYDIQKCEANSPFQYIKIPKVPNTSAGNLGLIAQWCCQVGLDYNFL